MANPINAFQAPMSPDQRIAAVMAALQGGAPLQDAGAAPAASPQPAAPAGAPAPAPSAPGSAASTGANLFGAAAAGGAQAAPSAAAAPKRGTGASPAPERAAFAATPAAGFVHALYNPPPPTAAQTAGENLYPGFAQTVKAYEAAHPAPQETPETYQAPNWKQRLLYGLGAGMAGWGRPEVGAEMVDRYRQDIEQHADQAAAYNRQIPEANARAQEQATTDAENYAARQAATANQYSEISGRLAAQRTAAEEAQIRLLQEEAALRGKPAFYTVPGSASPVEGYLTPNGLLGTDGKPLPEGAVPYRPAPEPKTTTVMIGGKAMVVPVAVGPDGQMHADLKHPIGPAQPNYASLPYFKQTLLFNAKTGSVMQGLLDQRSGRYVASNGDTDVFPISPEAGTQIENAMNVAQEGTTRLRVMQQNEADALKGDQQAMLSLLANHIGMTLGMQKGARINESVWNEAIQSAPWLQTVAAKWSKDGYLTGVTLTPEQVRQMVHLAQQRNADQWDQVVRVGSLNGVPLKAPSYASSDGGANGSIAVTDPAGGVHYFANQAAADRFKALAHIP